MNYKNTTKITLLKFFFFFSAKGGAVGNLLAVLWVLVDTHADSNMEDSGHGACLSSCRAARGMGLCSEDTFLSAGRLLYAKEEESLFSQSPHCPLQNQPTAIFNKEDFLFCNAENDF